MSGQSQDKSNWLTRFFLTHYLNSVPDTDHVWGKKKTLKGKKWSFIFCEIVNEASVKNLLWQSCQNRSNSFTARLFVKPAISTFAAMTKQLRFTNTVKIFKQHTYFVNCACS